MISLDLRDLRVVNTARVIRWTNGQRPSLLFAMVELAGECGEACNVAKKAARHELGLVGGDADTSRLAEELADVVICADLAASRAGIDLAQAIVSKFNATSARHGFPEQL